MSKFGYKNLLSETNFLKVRVRARKLMRGGSDLVAILYKDRTIVFKTKSGTTPGVVWTQTIEMTDLAIEEIANTKTYKDVENLIKSSALKVHCNCYAFHYWGFKYLAWKKGYGIEKEIRRPVVRNPYEQGYVCKHLYLVMQLYPFLAKSLASKFKNYADKKVEAEGMKDVQKMRMNKNEKGFSENLIQEKLKEELTK